MSDDQVSFFLSQKVINPEVEAALRRVVLQKSEIAALDQELASRRGQITGISEDQQRVRENMKALKAGQKKKRWWSVTPVNSISRRTRSRLWTNKFPTCSRSGSRHKER